MTTFKRWLTAYRKDESGSIAIETILIIPALFWAYLAMFAIFDAYRQYSINQKAAYTMGDIVSRETTPINGAYINGARKMLAYMTYADESDTALRVTSVFYNETDDIYEMDWSEARGWVSPLSGNDVKDWHDRLPAMADNDRVTIVETFVKYDPPFNTGLSNREIQNFVFTKPRYAPQVLFDPTN